MMKLGFILLIFIIHVHGFAQTPSGTAQRLFEQKSKYVYQVKTSISAKASKASYGSAFVINAQKGILATNYHVVSTAVQEPEKYKTYLVSKDVIREAKIIGIDVVHDLAILEVKTQYPSEMKISQRKTPQGEKVYSLGLPEDLNLSIIEGTYNGRIQSVVYDHIHLSSPINSGMSGGPTVNRNGDVIGVNVSYLRNSQNISFAVPAKYLVKLYENSLSRSPRLDVSQFQGHIEEQLLTTQKELTNHLLKEAKRESPFQTWSVAFPSAPVKCWTQNSDHQKKLYQKVEHRCGLSHASYLKNNRYSLSFEFSYDAVSSVKLNAWRFYYLLNKFYNGVSNRFDFLMSFFFDEEFYTKYDCSEELIQNSSNIGIQVNYCVRGYIKYPKLLEAEVKMAALTDEKESLLLRGRLRGFTLENIKKIILSQANGVKRHDHP